MSTHRDTHVALTLLAIGTIAATAVTATPAEVHAFCGFYVSGADGSLYNEATKVTLMREGRTTILSMQNTYQGPPADFAMVVPVPVVLSEENVKTLPAPIFDRIDQLAAPRLVEYWEQDPCPRPVRRPRLRASRSSVGGSLDDMLNASLGSRSHGVRVEAEFTVGEYDIQILSAQDSAGLETWLHEEDYNVPTGAGDVLRPYVEQGTKFFVAKVDVSRVTFTEGRAMLSPLRFHYEADEFSLPVRLGLLNSNGTQDLIVHILASQRYEAANYPNAFIPTNVRVRNRVRRNFGRFYAALFDKTLERNRGAVITEYSWQAVNCDPCPVPPLNPNEIATLGADVLPGANARGMVLTRLHYRYDRESLGDDLVFRPAEAVIGGRGMPNRGGRMTEQRATSRVNQFQGRYVMLNWWPGAITCDNPRRGIWGGPPDGRAPRPGSATNTAFVRSRRAPLSRWVRDDVPEIGLERHRPAAPSAPSPKSARLDHDGADVELDDLGGGGAALAGALLGLFVWRRRER